MSRSTTAEGTLTGRRTFRSSGAFTVPDGVYSLRALLVGGGGGAGGPANSSSVAMYGGPGGGGWPFIFDVPVTPGDIITVAVGAGGAAGARGTGINTGDLSNNGTDGGPTSLFINGVLAATAHGGGYGGGGINGGSAGAPGRIGGFSLGSGPSQGAGSGGAGGGYNGGACRLNEWERPRFGRRTTGRGSSSQLGGSNGQSAEFAITGDAATSNLTVEAMLTQPLRLQYGAGGLISNLLTPTAPPANSGQGGEGGPTTAGGVSTAGASGIAAIEWEVTAA